MAVSADSIYDSAGRKVARRNRQTERERERDEPFAHLQFSVRRDGTPFTVDVCR